MKSLLREVHHRSLWQVLGIYAAGSWVALQVVNEINDAVGLPGWVQGAALTLLVVGFPMVLATAFFQKGSGGAPASPAPGVETADPPTTETAPAAPESGGHRLFTWRNAILGGAGAFALLGIVTAGYMAMRTLGIGPAGTLVAAGVLDERDPILVAELASGSGDDILARTLTEALRSDLAQSPVVTLLGPDQVADALERMRRPRDSALDLPLARELALREGIKAVIGGEVNAAGAGYVLTAQVVSAATGEVLVSRRESAASENDVIDAIDRLSKGLRERLGESLKSVRSSPPLARMTTASLDALEKFQEGYRRIDLGDRAGGLELLYEAVAIDTAFAAAWRKIATELGNPGNPADVRAREIEAATKGYRHQDRLTEFEQVRAEAIYHRSVTGDTDRELAVYERGVIEWPASTSLLNNLAVQLFDMEEFARAEEVARRGLAVDTTRLDLLLRINLARSLLHQGRMDAADSLAAATAGRFPPNVRFFSVIVPLTTRLNRGDWSGASAILDSVATRGTPLRAVRDRVAVMRGRLTEASTAAQPELDRLARAGSRAQYLETAIGLALVDARLRGDREGAVREVEAALERYPLDEIDPLNRPYARLAEFNALVGRTDRARDLLDDFEALVVQPLGVVWNREWHRARSELALAERRFEDAVAEQRTAERHACRHRCPELARVYDLSGQQDSALALYMRYVDSPLGVENWDLEGLSLAPALERLGQLYDERGELEQAAQYYARFVEQWAEADEELQPRVRAAQARLEEILREIG